MVDPIAQAEMVETEEAAPKPAKKGKGKKGKKADDDWYVSSLSMAYHTSYTLNYVKFPNPYYIYCLVR